MRNSYLVARAFPRGLFVFVLGRAGMWKGAVRGLASPQEALSFPTRNLLAERPPQPLALRPLDLAFWAEKRSRPAEMLQLA